MIYSVCFRCSGFISDFSLYVAAVTDSGVLHTCAPRRQYLTTKQWSTGAQDYVAMQGRCWAMDLSTRQQTSSNYLARCSC